MELGAGRRNCRATSFATLLSTALLCLTGGITLVGWLSTEQLHSFRITEGIHIGISGGSVGSRFVFYNNARYGPYTGSVVGLVGDDVPVQRGFGDSLGVYYRHFFWPDHVVWTLAVTVWYPLVLFAIWPCRAALKMRRRARSESLRS